ncbi:nucleotidyltransferase domain-containing protein [Thiofaba sp. EF100]|uniref:nucleotidyltransferase family protein n=1 Tax=Thiofaba sp. EF100 TaxID=3121274 RepID=UPI0032216D26
MRLTPEQADIIRQSVHTSFGPQARVWLFGSRVDDAKRGGDIDLLIQPPPPWPGDADILRRKIDFLVQLERQLGERKIDVVIEQPEDTRPIVRIAHETGIEL